MAINPVVPAFIDPPYWGGLQDWLDYRDELRRLAPLPGLGPFVREADEKIAHLSPHEK
jgi:hypothetical protein